MKRSLFLAVSVIALTAVADQLLAAESETPTPSERAAPAARRAAPQRARPAPTPQRQASTSQSSSFTGTQAGGFGGGNAGGGGFADPAFCGGGSGFSPLCGTTTQNIGKSTGALGGLEFGQMIPMGGYWAWGWAVDAQGSTLRSEGNQQSTKVVPLGAPGAGNVINEGMSTSQTQPFGTTLRLKLGVMAMPGTLIYVTGGGAGGLVHGDFTYQATTASCPSTPNCTAYGQQSYDKFRWGYTAGAGVTFSIPGSPVGVTLEYLHTDLGTVDQTILVTQGGIPTSTSTGAATTSMKTQSEALRLKFSMGL